jgi:hypothetical protein
MISEVDGLVVCKGEVIGHFLPELNGTTEEKGE